MLSFGTTLIRTFILGKLQNCYIVIMSRIAGSNFNSSVLVGGADHKVGDGSPKEAMASLELWLHKHFDVVAVLQRWSAEFYYPADGIPFIGEISGLPSIYCATGFLGQVNVRFNSSFIYRALFTQL